MVKWFLHLLGINQRSGIRSCERTLSASQNPSTVSAFPHADLLLAGADVFHLGDERGLALVQGLLQLLKGAADLRDGLAFPLGELLGYLADQVDGSRQLR